MRNGVAISTPFPIELGTRLLNRFKVMLMRKKSLVLIICFLGAILTLCSWMFCRQHIIFEASENSEWPYDAIKYVDISDVPHNKLNIAIIDTGIDLTQPDFQRIHIKTYSVLNENEPDNDNEHGTMVAKLICNSKLINQKNANITSNITFHVIDIGDGKNLTIQKLVDGIDLALKLKVDIINLSLGTYKNDETLKAKIQEVVDERIIIVCASGDDATKQYLYPASYEGVISVSCTDMNNVNLLNNNMNDKIIVCAPGEKIPVGENSGKIKITNGSSAASAIVTDVIIVLKSIKPSLNSYDIIDIFKKTSMDLGDKGRDEIYGYGLVNFKDCIMYVKSSL
ncbi:S8 family peptidase [Clostridium thermosuccinogenes]|uniref:S8 family peptidase n=1 Tax=Clostridium thermosuccinogenes TaxID=84032 RepID=UPI00125FA4DA|nr:S8 family serine peptidase [Pseudoclostridium thermosuccinogenes]